MVVVLLVVNGCCELEVSESVDDSVRIDVADEDAGLDKGEEVLGDTVSVYNGAWVDAVTDDAVVDDEPKWVVGVEKTVPLLELVTETLMAVVILEVVVEPVVAMVELVALTVVEKLLMIPLLPVLTLEDS